MYLRRNQGLTTRSKIDLAAYVSERYSSWLRTAMHYEKAKQTTGSKPIIKLKPS